MKNTFGHAVSVTLFGESHGPEIGAVLDGMSAGVRVDSDYIDACLARRRPQDEMSTARREPDRYRIISGVKDGYTTGAPLTVIIPNSDVRSGDYDAMQGLVRPNHADFTAHYKYHGYADPRGGGHFSGRLTAPLVALGAIARTALANVGVQVGAHIERIGGATDKRFSLHPEEELAALADAPFPVLEPTAEPAMRAEVRAARAAGDSIGGVIECAVTGVQPGVGAPWFDAVECVLSRALFAIPAVRGVEFGDGFAMASMRGSEANDLLHRGENAICFDSNHSGGVQGGITNGMPIVLRVAVKPTPTIGREQPTVNLATGENTTIAGKGRHDPAIVHRACSVVEAVTALVLCDLLAEEHGSDYFRQIDDK